MQRCRGVVRVPGPRSGTAAAVTVPRTPTGVPVVMRAIVLGMTEALDDPAARERLLRDVDPSRVREHHQLLRDILRAEMRDRSRAADGGKYFENLYWCAFLLYLVGDPSDVPVMWQAK